MLKLWARNITDLAIAQRNPAWSWSIGDDIVITGTQPLNFNRIITLKPHCNLQALFGSQFKRHWYRHSPVINQSMPPNTMGIWRHVPEFTRLTQPWQKVCGSGGSDIIISDRDRITSNAATYLWSTNTCYLIIRATRTWSRAHEADLILVGIFGVQTEAIGHSIAAGLHIRKGINQY